MAAPSVYVYFHTHWDREWYDPFRVYQLRLAEVVDAILDHLDAGLYPCFMLDGQTVLLEDYLELRPQQEGRLKQAIQSGCLAIGPWYVMPDEFLVSGESLIRNLQRGISLSKTWLGKRAAKAVFTGYLPDTFGHSADMPMILKQFGISSAVVWRGVNPKNAEFCWQSPSGDSVTTLHLSDGYFQMHLTDVDLTDSDRVTAIQKLVQKLSTTAIQNRILLPIGADHLGSANAKALQLLTQAVPKYTVTTPGEFLKSASLKSVSNHNLACIQNELLDNSTAFVLQGVWSSRLYLKQRNRRLEHVLTHQLEPLIAMVQGLCDNVTPYPKEALDTAWKLLLLNHPHDSICGCSVDEVHRQNESRFDEVAALCEAMTHRQWSALIEYAQVSQDHWLVINHGDKPYTGVVPATQDHADGGSVKLGLLQLSAKEQVLLDAYHTDPYQVPLAHKTVWRKSGWIWVENIAPHSLAVIPKAQRRLPKAMAHATENTLENDLLNLVCTAEGMLAVTVKATRVVYPHLHSLIDRPEQGDSYNGAPVPGQQEQTAEFLGCRQVFSGPLIAALLLTYRLGQMVIQTQVTLKAGSPQVEFETQFVNSLPDHCLQVSFESAEPIREVFAESHFSWLKREYDPTFDLSAQMPVAQNRELRPNTGPIQRCIGYGQQGLITEGLTEYEVKDNSLRLTLLRAFGMLSKADTGVRGAQAGPPLPTPEGQCLGRALVCRYAWLPLETPKNAFEYLYEQANRFYGVVMAREGLEKGAVSQKPCQNNLVVWDNPAIVSTAYHYAPATQSLPAGILLRLMNTTDTTQKTAFSTGIEVTEALQVDFLGEPVAGSDDCIRKGLTLRPFGVQSVLFCVK